MDSCIIAVLVICSLTAPAFGDKGTSKARSCSDIKLFYSGKGFALDGVPQSEISGEHLRVCPQGYTCCTSDMEDNLATLSRREMEGLLKNDGRSLQNALVGQHKTFDGYFMELLNRSAIGLHATLSSAWGILYVQNAQVFSDLYADLRRYYRGSNVNLEEVLNEFWVRLLEKLLHHTNKQSLAGEDYLECVSKQMETLRPFGDHPRTIKVSVTRAVLAARSFVQGLAVSGEVVRKVSQVRLSLDCMRAIMKMTYCPHCRGMASARPCANYCTNVMKGCLANQADLNTEWRHLADTMMQVADHLHGPSGVEDVILTLPNSILDGVSTMMENMEAVKHKLGQACGRLGEGQPSGAMQDEVKQYGRVTVDEIQLGKTGSSSEKIGTLVAEVRTKLEHMRPYWVSLPRIVCSDRVATGIGAEDKCWNGMSRARYLPEIIGDGLANQINNPEVEIDITKPDIMIRQQIMQLKITTHRLKNALNGRDVDFQDTSDDASGSGSGACADEMCHQGRRIVILATNQPVFNTPENKEVRSSAAQNLPCVTINLLLLLGLLLRR
ncbi:glypican-1b [Takifugu flavidus]|uniref:glypican-1b n=1 Tax=Takifugu flavidus TaxID=433684 RepID=UPI00254475AE|nr:glypican-1b [Takifugu flavidus]XP_056911985.1 glypican-1b [Takifugu flavidus]